MSVDGLQGNPQPELASVDPRMPERRTPVTLRVAAVELQINEVYAVELRLPDVRVGQIESTE